MDRIDWTLIVSRVLVGATLVGVVLFIRQVMDVLEGAPAGPAETAMIAGFLLLAAVVAGALANDFQLPKVTGYILVGLLLGPEVVGVLTDANLGDLQIFDHLAIGIIAFVAGAELRPDLLREHGRNIGIILLVEIAAVIVLITVALMLARPLIPFLADETLLGAVLLSLVFASVAAINSPAVAIAVLEEEDAAGPVSSTTLGVVVVADVVVVLLVTLTLSLARHVVVPETGPEGNVFLLLSWELIGAIVMGGLLGVLISLYLRKVGAHLPIFVVFLALFGFDIAQALHVEFMLFMLSAGFFVENVSPVESEPLLEALHKVSLPAYALFFALAGASIHLVELRELWPLALMVVGVRAAGIWGGCRVGADLADAPDSVRKYTWMGLVSQAGVALGLVTVAARVLGEPGEAMRTLFLAMIAIHEIVGPVLFRIGLAQAGEIGAAEEEAGGEEAESREAPATA